MANLEQTGKIRRLKSGLFLSFCLCSALVQAEVKFRLPLSSDTSVHYYVDHDDTSGRSDWKCETQTYDGHRGTDFSGGPRGRAIYAAAVGTVSYKIDGFGDGGLGNTDGGGGGNYVKLAHPDGFTTFYFHMTSGSVTSKAVGASVACGEQIGGVGTSGNSTGFHLHFEPRVNGFSDDPFAGTCGGPLSYWVNQGTGSPTTNCFSLIPPAPSNLVAQALSTNQIRLMWTDHATNETGVKIERATGLTGPWSQVAIVTTNVVAQTNSGLIPSSTYFYRIRSYNGSGNSDYSNLTYASTSNSAPILPVVPTKVVNAGATVTFATGATDAGVGLTTVITDFEEFASNTSSVMFRPPAYSSTTASFIDTSPNVAAITDTFPTNGNPSGKALNARFSFKTGMSHPWLRLTTSQTASLPNPTLHFGQTVRFSLYADKAIKIGLGVRETGTDAAIGANGGITGPIEFVGSPSKTGDTPNPLRDIAAGVWTNLSFALPTEPVVEFTGDGVLSSATAKGTLESLTLLPSAGSGTYEIYVDDFTSFSPNTLTYSLEPGAPAGASVNPTNGTFTWSAPFASTLVTNSVVVKVTDNGSPALSSFRAFDLVVVPAPRVTSAVLTNGQIHLEWETYVGKNYKVQFKDNLNAVAWTDLGSMMTTAENSLSKSDTVNTNAQRFYRIVQVD